MENKVRSLYLRLCGTCVFRGVLELPLFRRFFEYAEEKGSAERRLSAYGAFVAEIYAGGGDLTDCVRRAVFENENVYVTSHVSGRPRNACIDASAERELTAFSEFAALAPADFAADMGCEIEVPAFSSEKADLVTEYAARVREIDKYGYGIFAAYGMLRLADGPHPVLEPIRTPDRITLDAFVGYEEERGKLLDRRLYPVGMDYPYLTFMVVVCTIGLCLLQIIVLQKIPAFTVNLTYNLEPVYSIILSMFIFKEYKELNFSFCIGITLIILSVLLQTWTEIKRRKAQS